MYIYKVFILILLKGWASCTIDGLSYMDSLELKPSRGVLPGDDPCNPLYWYPRIVPEHCKFKATLKPDDGKPPEPIPLPIPIPAPPPPIMYPSLPPIPPMSPMPSVPPIPPMVPYLVPPPMPLPYGVPIVPSNPMLPVPGVPFPIQSYSYDFYRRYSQTQAGMVPGIPGIVSPDGGINILPFSDAYSDLLEKYKQKKLRKRLQRLFNEYERSSTFERSKRRRKNEKYYK